MKLPSSRNERPRRATPRLRGLPLGLPRAGEEKMLLTDFCNRHTTRAPVDRPISEREAFAVTDRYRASLRPTVRCASTPFAVPAPCCLAATRPQIDVRLTAYIELRLHRSQPRPISGQGRAPLRVVLPCRGFVDRAQGWRRTPLTLPVAPREHPSRRPEPHFEEPGPLLPPTRQRERLTPAQSVFHRQCAPKSHRFRGELDR